MSVVDQELNICFSKRDIINRKKFINYLEKKRLDENGKNKRGYKRDNINQRLNKLIRDGIVKSIKSSDFERYGIQETDNRVAYLILKEKYDIYQRAFNISNNLDTIFKDIENNDIKNKIDALKEIEDYKKVYLMKPEQLDVLVKELTEENNDLIDLILKIISYNIFDKKIEPDNKNKLLKQLRSLLKRYPENPEGYPKVKDRIILLLGRYKDIDSIVEQLEKDLKKTSNPDLIVKLYGDRVVAQVIEDNILKLYNLKKKLQNDNEYEALNILAQIRAETRMCCGLTDY
ncbi:hypothetical protein ACT9XH_02905 [Methanococcoides methylutens]|uniref:hypothetical protein n=1 Tax=Methanococcoides methylutens TaxID=2226 RepID=UPI004044E0F5